MGARVNMAAYVRERREQINRELARQIIEEAKKIRDMGYGSIAITCEEHADYAYTSRTQYGGM